MPMQECYMADDDTYGLDENGSKSSECSMSRERNRRIFHITDSFDPKQNCGEKVSAGKDAVEYGMGNISFQG